MKKPTNPTIGDKGWARVQPPLLASTLDNPPAPSSQGSGVPTAIQERSSRQNNEKGRKTQGCGSLTGACWGPFFLHLPSAFPLAKASEDLTGITSRNHRLDGVAGHSRVPST